MPDWSASPAEREPVAQQQDPEAGANDDPQQLEHVVFAMLAHARMSPEVRKMFGAQTKESIADPRAVANARANLRQSARLCRPMWHRMRHSGRGIPMLAAIPRARSSCPGGRPRFRGAKRAHGPPGKGDSDPSDSDSNACLAAGRLRLLAGAPA
jgi:hypothetical protein